MEFEKEDRMWVLVQQKRTLRSMARFSTSAAAATRSVTLGIFLVSGPGPSLALLDLSMQVVKQLKNISTCVEILKSVCFFGPGNWKRSFV